MNMINTKKIDEFRYNILNWHKYNYRSYPWRNEVSPYKIMIAEFLLQRTKADQVAPIYINFLKTYPTINLLLKANIEDIQKLIEPLGLKWRAAHIKKAAEYIVKEYNCIFPSSKEELIKIPGIGDYVAGAILAISFSKSDCIIDSNIARVLNRYFGLNLKGEIRRKKEIIDISCKLFKDKEPKLILFSIIDFGAMICTPLNPKHEICPIKNKCRCYINKYKKS